MNTNGNHSSRKGAGVAVLVYHGFFRQESELTQVPAEAQRYFVSTGMFAKHLDYLVEQGFEACSLDAYLSAPPPDKDAGQGKSVILTMDGGYVSSYELALPMLKERGFSATWFPVANWTGQPGKMSAEQLRAVAAEGMPVGSHGLNYTPLAGASREVARQEVVESKQKLEEMLGMKMRQLALSEGFVSHAVVDLARKTGYENLCFSRPGFYRGGFLVKRMGIMRMTDVWGLAALVNRNRKVVGKRYVMFMAIQGTKRLIGMKNYEKVIGKLQDLRGGKRK